MVFLISGIVKAQKKFKHKTFSNFDLCNYLNGQYDSHSVKYFINNIYNVYLI